MHSPCPPLRNLAEPFRPFITILVRELDFWAKHSTRSRLIQRFVERCCRPERLTKDVIGRRLGAADRPRVPFPTPNSPGAWERSMKYKVIFRPGSHWSPS